MSRNRVLPAVLALALAPAAFGQQTLQLPALSVPLPAAPSLVLPLPPFTLPSIPPLPVVPIGPRLQGQIPVTYRGSGLIIFYDTQSPYPVEYTLVGIVDAP